jgi:hypothetical protein
MKNVKFIATMLLCLFLILNISIIASAEDENIIYTDPRGDVYDFFDIESDSISGTDEVPNIDIKEIKYYHEEGSKKATLTLQVYGEIEDRGNPEDNFMTDGDFPIGDSLDSVAYGFVLVTDMNYYTINYINKTCVLISDIDTINLTDWTVNKDILSINIDLESADESFTELNGQTTDINFDLTSESGGIYIDIAPSLLFVEIVVENVKQEIGSNVKFSADVQDEFGNTEGFSYLWDFDDGSSVSRLENPTHKYNTVGNYTVKLTVEDDLGNKGNSTKIIQIIEKDANGDNNGNDNGNSQNGSESGLNLFITIIAVIIIIGILVIIFIVRR